MWDFKFCDLRSSEVLRSLKVNLLATFRDASVSSSRVKMPEFLTIDDENDASNNVANIPPNDLFKVDIFHPEVFIK
jgi:hypothetical protein